MKIAIIGAGIFGVTIANHLSTNHEVHIYEKNEGIFQSASDVNQCRIHRGYHYPRSKETVDELKTGEKSFLNEYGSTIIPNTSNYYCIAKQDSLTTKEDYLDFCNSNKLKYSLDFLPLIDYSNVDICVKVDEQIFDHEKLKKLCLKRLNQNNVHLHFNHTVTKEIFDKFEHVILCTYSNLNEFLNQDIQTKFQFEICEKVFVRLPKEFERKSILIMDGSFMSVDPVGSTGLHILGHVIYTVHNSNIGMFPKIPTVYSKLLNSGIISVPEISNFQKFIDSTKKFIPEIIKAEYVGSSFCIKTVLPNVDKTDTRPTIIKPINHKITKVFSGKIPVCVETAKQISNMLVDKYSI